MVGCIELKHNKFYERGFSQALSKEHVVEAIAQLEARITELEADRETLIEDIQAVRDDKERLWCEKTALKAKNLQKDVASAKREDEVDRLKKLAVQAHYHCEDYYYSCPQDEGGCYNEDRGPECDCGADEHNAEVARVVGEEKFNMHEKRME